MEFCQHIPVLYHKQEQEQPVQTKVTCRRCTIGTSWTTAGEKATWNGWASLMVDESDARAKAVAARAEQVDPALVAKAADSVRWNAFCGAAKMNAGMSRDAAAHMGDDARIHAKIVSALREHLTGGLNEQRIHDLFVPLRKATRAFLLNAKLETPAHRDVPGELDGVALADAITKSVVARAGAAIEQKIAEAFARERAGSLRSTRPAPLVVKFLGAGGYDPEPRQAIDDGLVVGRAYEVLCGLVDRNSTRLILLGVPGIGFNSVMFDGVDYAHPCMHRLNR